ncbi:zinc metallopeptidase [Sporolactobacillus terrae]|uniref:Zinc metallopeptidase n=1 Tax=Sporolactobacillus terrae TaxID=269673 RepID=A0A410D948_9BACL|nr:zinc metallopeptidase [Sporolactobacillus terrae]QAA22605.1 Zn-dependent protease [Sporolactobacillus terrae]QAA25579.1 Zn-dependent protease [Sporolactobacillus terrae]UAK17387.1 zinc metallopeptidase [Sporolactobacillus terrae]BBN98929.1 zinc metallopeptidase [Sporolactobacillus terrae]
MIQYLIYLGILMLIPMWAQMRVRSTYARYAEVSNSTGMTGAQTARRILDDNGLYDVTVREVAGSLTDHYDPRDKSINLSTDIYHGASIAGTAVAAHEVGHAIQDANDYTFMRVRSALVPVANLGSNLSYILILAGVFLGMFQLAALGVVFFAAAVLFQVVTLPVEFDASSRALKQIVSLGIVQENERPQAKKVLSAAAMTYVAAALVSVMELVRFILMITMSNREE